METTKLTAEQLLSNLKEDKNKEVFSITGYVKLQENESQEAVLFNTGKGSAKWVAIPVSMLESVEILGKTIQDGDMLTAARLFLNKPSSEEGSFLASIISIIGQSNEFNMGGENIGIGIPRKVTQNNEISLGINDGTLPLSVNNAIGIGQALHFRNPVIWLASWQVGNG